MDICMKELALRGSDAPSELSMFAEAYHEKIRDLKASAETAQVGSWVVVLGDGVGLAENHWMHTWHLATLLLPPVTKARLPRHSLCRHCSA